MKSLTKQEAIDLHRKMWNWIADETEKRKKKVTKNEYFDETNIDDDDRPFQYCYCCEYDTQQDDDERPDNFCISCPINWGNKVNLIPCTNMYKINDHKGLYEQWRRNKNHKQSAKLARQIANLPEYKDKEENTNNETIN